MRIRTTEDLQIQCEDCEMIFPLETRVFPTIAEHPCHSVITKHYIRQECRHCGEVSLLSGISGVEYVYEAWKCPNAPKP